VVIAGESSSIAPAIYEEGAAEESDYNQTIMPTEIDDE